MTCEANNYSRTPSMSKHALQRCVEMEISTKVAKAIVRNADMVVPGHQGGEWIATWTGDPRYAVVYADRVNEFVVITVLHNVRGAFRFVRRVGGSYEIEEED